MASATQKGHLDGLLAGRTVNIKWYDKLEDILDLHPVDGPDYYLVLTGPRTAPRSSRGGQRPLVIASAFLFEAQSLLDRLLQRGVKLGIATSVAQAYRRDAEVYPDSRNVQLPLPQGQRDLLGWFRGEVLEKEAPMPLVEFKADRFDGKGIDFREALR